MFFKSTILLLLFGLVRPQTKYCCTPPQWESRFNLISGGTNQGKPYFVQENQNVSIDGNAHKVAASVSVTTNGVTSHIQIIQDFDGGKQYSITNGNCQTATLAPWTPKCVPDDAKLLTKTYFGTGDKKVAFDVYSFTKDVNTYIVDVASADCTPLYLTGHGSKNNVTGFSIGTYSNMTLGIKDPSVFDIPDSCKHNPFGANTEATRLHSVF